MTHLLPADVEIWVSAPTEGRLVPRSGATDRQETTMKYLVLIYGNKELWDSFPAEELADAIAKQDAFNEEFADTGELLGAYGLSDETMAKTVRVRDGVPAVTDGPYVEAKEFIASFYMLDVPDEARALEIAAQIPFATHNAVEVWPVLHEAAEDV
jgi:hypothetical protein